MLRGSSGVPHTDKDVLKLKAVQRRAARYVTNRYHNTSLPSEIVSHLQWDTLQQRRAKIPLIHNLIEIPYEQYLLPSTSTYEYQTLNFKRPFTATNYLKYSFFPRTIAQWNSLPMSTKAIPNLECFKVSISETFIPDLFKNEKIQPS